MQDLGFWDLYRFRVSGFKDLGFKDLGCRI